MTTTRHGSSLIELLVALPLVALLTAVAVQLLLHVHRDVIATDGALGATRELRHGANILAGEWRGLRNSDLVTWTDTSVEFRATVGLGVVCNAQQPRNTVALLERDDASSPASSNGNTPAAAIWNQSVQPGDSAQLWFAGPSPADTLTTGFAQIQSSGLATACQGSALQGVSLGNALRLTLTDTLSSAPAVGTPVRITRRTRYSLYRSSDGDWYLGRKTRGASGWDVIQPVAGPLLAPGDSGVAFSVLDSLNSPIRGLLPSANQRAVRMHALLRAPARVGRSSPASVRTDSVRIDIQLRTR